MAITTSKKIFSAILNSKLPSQYREQNRTVPYAGFSELVTAEAAVRRCSSKQVFLKIHQYSQENTCGGISFLIKLLISLYLVLMLENTDQKISEQGHFLRSVWVIENMYSGNIQSVFEKLKILHERKTYTAQKMKFFIQNFSSKYDQICSKLH